MKSVRSIFLGLVAVAGVALALGGAEAPSTSAVKHWGVSLRMPDGGLSRFEGGEARPSPGGIWDVSEFRLENFGANGKSELLVEAPKCSVDVTKRLASSDGPLKVTRTENGISLTGQGFLYNDVDKRLIVSNRSQIVIHATLFKENSLSK